MTAASPSETKFGNAEAEDARVLQRQSHRTRRLLVPHPESQHIRGSSLESTVAKQAELVVGAHGSIPLKLSSFCPRKQVLTTMSRLLLPPD